jgi:very-short-patch-repair endonuclease
VKQFYAANPEHNRGTNHHMHGRQHKPESIEKMRASHKGRTVTPGMLKGLQAGRDYFRGKTKETDPAIARRARTLSQKYSGIPNPEHGERMKKYYEENPDKHLNKILAQKGHETSIERAMRLGLTERGIAFETQYRIGRYFADFALLGCKLVIEVDGAHWHDCEKDARRDEEIAATGWRVIRFSEQQVKRQLPECIQKIIELMQQEPL